MFSRLPHLTPLLLATGCVGDYVIVPGPGGIFLLLIVVMAALVAFISIIDRLLGRKINRTLAKMASAWMKGRERR